MNAGGPLHQVASDLGLGNRPHLDEEHIVLGVLDAVDRNSSVTQRNVSLELGIALGLANAYLKRCVRKGFIKVATVPSRRYAYFLTPQGFAEKSRLTASYLSHSFAFFRRARTQCSEIFDDMLRHGQQRIGLIGAGDLAEIALLVARERPEIEILGVFAPTDAAALLEMLSAAGKVDALVITALDDPTAAFETARKAFASDAVYAPELLRVRSNRKSRDPEL